MNARWEGMKEKEFEMNHMALYKVEEEKKQNENSSAPIRRNF